MTFLEENKELLDKANSYYYHNNVFLKYFNN